MRNTFEESLTYKLTTRRCRNALQSRTSAIILLQHVTADIYTTNVKAVLFIYTRLCTLILDSEPDQIVYTYFRFRTRLGLWTKVLFQFGIIYVTTQKVSKSIPKRIKGVLDCTGQSSP